MLHVHPSISGTYKCPWNSQSSEHQVACLLKLCLEVAARHDVREEAKKEEDELYPLHIIVMMVIQHNTGKRV